MKITNDEGRTFLVRVVREGERYGLDDCIVYNKDTDSTFYENDPLIEFYDLSVDLRKFGPRGQFVSRYHASQLAKDSPYGLDLHGGVPEWKIDALTLQPVRLLARGLCAHPERCDCKGCRPELYV